MLEIVEFARADLKQSDAQLLAVAKYHDWHKAGEGSWAEASRAPVRNVGRDDLRAICCHVANRLCEAAGIAVLAVL
jgi:hypothetical protein